MKEWLPTELQRGFYGETFNMHLCLGNSKYEEYGDYESLGLYCYGVCDSIEQFIGRYGQRLDADPRKLVVSYCTIRKADEPEEGGWRWHKWGPYIGDDEPKCEYLYDEPDIEQACVFHIIELKD